ncbi:hypothetical protein TNCV_4404621 [Trichonephila clavipes]|uniref:Uncharacterized protein n=1 Tax=Trichonephila clavipes TaxID=2585209 RepID=A0A8X6VH33_TRICX|nr:hypothetical protein TNCV_4404621 [Trichonephila clavipes]
MDPDDSESLDLNLDFSDVDFSNLDSPGGLTFSSLDFSSMDEEPTPEEIEVVIATAAYLLCSVENARLALTYKS